MGQRAERFAREIQRTLSGELLAEVKDPRVSEAGFLTVTHVRVSDDLSIAHVSVSLLGAKADDKQGKDLIAGLTSAAPYLKRALVRQLNAKKVPDLRFHLDDVDARAEKVDAIFRELEEERRKKGEGA